MSVWQAFKAGAGRVASSHAAREFAENTLHREAAEIGADAASAAAFQANRSARMSDLMNDFAKESAQVSYSPNGLGEYAAYQTGNIGSKAVGAITHPMTVGAAMNVLPMAFYMMPQGQPEEYVEQQGYPQQYVGY
ncbi:MAG: hypothetical protein WBF90_33770 [Rivularia sp. (in: cyanobacteria)]